MKRKKEWMNQTNSYNLIWNKNNSKHNPNRQTEVKMDRKNRRTDVNMDRQNIQTDVKKNQKNRQTNVKMD